MAYATFVDVQAVRPSLTEADREFVDSLIDYASLIIDTEIPGVAAKKGVDPQYQELVEKTVVFMVRRFLLNPNGVYSKTRSLDDYSATDVVDKAISSGELYLNEFEKARLLGARRGAFSITPAVEPVPVHCWWPQ